MQIATNQNKQDILDYEFLEKLRTKTERQLQIMLNAIGKDITKISAEKTKLENKILEKKKREHFIKDAIMEKWRQPSNELLQAIQEVKNGETTTYSSVNEMMVDLNA